MRKGLRQGVGLLMRSMSIGAGISAAAFGFSIALQNIVWGISQPEVYPLDTPACCGTWWPDLNEISPLPFSHFLFSWSASVWLLSALWNGIVGFLGVYMLNPHHGKRPKWPWAFVAIGVIVPLAAAHQIAERLQTADVQARRAQAHHEIGAIRGSVKSPQANDFVLRPQPHHIYVDGVDFGVGGGDPSEAAKGTVTRAYF